MSLLYNVDHHELDPRTAAEMERLVAAIQTQLGDTGRRVDIPFNSRYFSVDSGTITALESNLLVFSYTLIGNYLTVFFDIQGLAVTGTPSIISITAPEGFRVRVGDRLYASPNRLYRQPCLIQTDAGNNPELGEVWVTNNISTAFIDNTGSQASMHFHQADDGTFAAGTSIRLYGHCTFEFEPRGI